MEEFEEIKKTWNNQEEAKVLPDVKEIIKKTEIMKRKTILKHAIGIGVLLLTFVYISTFLFAYDFAFISTYIGIIVVLLSIVLGIAFQSQLIGIMLPKSDFTTNSQQHIGQSLLYQSRLKYLHKTGTGIYYTGLSLGLAAYMYEFAARDLKFGIIAYSITAVWIVFSWVYLRKRSIVRQKKRVDDYINSLSEIQNHLQEN